MAQASPTEFIEEKLIPDPTSSDKSGQSSSSSNRKKILVVNDDGVKSIGLKSLALALEEIGDVVVVATIDDQIHPSFSITIDGLIRAKKMNSWGKNIIVYCVSGFPMNCLKFAYGYVLPKILKWDHLDLCIAGINKGKNIGTDLLYSGTMSLACAARFEHSTFMNNNFTPNSIAISLSPPSIDIIDNNNQQFDWKFETAVKCSLQIAKLALKSEQTPNVVWNVNIPTNPIKSASNRYTWAVTRPAILKHDPSNLITVIRRNDDNKTNNIDFHINGPSFQYNNTNIDIGTDYYALNNNVISISPIELTPSLHSPLHATNNLITLLTENSKLFNCNLNYFWDINVNIRPLISIIQCLKHWLNEYHNNKINSNSKDKILLQTYTLYLERDIKICNLIRNNLNLQNILAKQFGWSSKSEKFNKTLTWIQLQSLYKVLNDTNIKQIQIDHKNSTNYLNKSVIFTGSTILISMFVGYFLNQTFSSKNNKSNKK